MLGIAADGRDGAALTPPQPVASGQTDVRHLHVLEGEPRDEAEFVTWVQQAAALPGEKMQGRVASNRRAGHAPSLR